MSYTNKYNVLLSAYACEPGKGSEPEVGWGTATSLAQNDTQNNYFVLTRTNNRKAIESQSYPSNLTFIYFELPKLFLKLKKAGRFTRIYYYLWMFGAVKYIKKSPYKFDIIHHITFVNDWLPSLFIDLKRKDNKFIWGPIGSHAKVPEKFLFTTKEQIIEFFRMALQRIFRSLDPYFNRCKQDSDAIIGINEGVTKNLKLKTNNFLVSPAIAIRKEQISKSANSEEETFKILSVGRLIHIKNFKLTLRSFSKFLNLINKEKRSNIKLCIIGSGSQRKELSKMSEQLLISSNVEFIDHLPQEDLMKIYHESDLFLFPTLESAGFVILEAMSKGLPVVALNYGGPGQFVKQMKREQLVEVNLALEEIENEMAQLILHLFENRSLRIKIGELNQQTVFDEFTWEAKSQKFITVYRDLLNEKPIHG